MDNIINLNGKEINIEDIIDKIIDYRNDKDVHQISKFNLKYLISYIEKASHIKLF